MDPRLALSFLLIASTAVPDDQLEKNIDAMARDGITSHRAPGGRFP